MKRRMLIKGFRLALSIALIFAFVVPAAYAATKEEINAGVSAALKRFNEQVKGAHEFREISKGMLVIPNVTKAAFIVGGQYGQGALKEDDRFVDYYSLAAGSLGYQIGAEKYDLVIIFATEEALQKFKLSEGWEAGVNAEVTLVDKGLDLPVSTLVSRNPVLGFVFDQKGIMAGVSIKGAKFTRIHPK